MCCRSPNENYIEENPRTKMATLNWLVREEKSSINLFKLWIYPDAVILSINNGRKYCYKEAIMMLSNVFDSYNKTQITPNSLEISIFV